jgi:hypothetical protein
MDLKSFEMFSKEHDQTDRFDTLICSAAGALFAYIGQTNKPQEFDSWYYFITPTDLLVLATCFGFGLWVLYVSKLVTRMNKELLMMLEESTSILQLLWDNQKLDLLFNPRKGPASRDDLLKIVATNATKMDALHKEANGRMAFENKLEITRNWLLLAGFMLIFVDKALQPYFGAD